LIGPATGEQPNGKAAENYAARTCAATDVRAERGRETRAMLESVIAGVDGDAGDADALALGELLADPGAHVIPTNVSAVSPTTS
jgi:hypothetical protein